MIRHLLLGTAALIAAAPAFAQTAAAEEESPAEIVVTAQKRSEKLQDIPIAISVVSGDQLTRQGALNIENAQYLVPTLNFRKSGTTLNQSLYLRGVGTATFSIAGEPSVSTVLDGVVLQRSGEAFSDLVDIERIEVLRGPQGTLYGKNASAGVISIVSRRPTDKFEGYVEGSYFGGNGDEWRLRGAINVPWNENVRTRVTGFYGTWEGNITNINPAVNRRVNGYRRYGIRAVTEADLSDTVKATVILDWRQAKDNCCAEVIAQQNGGALPTGVAGLALAGINLRGDETRQINQNLITRTEETSWGASLQLDAELGTHTVTSITSYRKYNNREIRDGDWVGGPVAGIPQLHDDGPQTGTAFTQEFRVTSPADWFFSYVVGAFYSHTPSERTFTRNVVSCNPAPAPAALVPCGSAGAPATQTFTGTATFGSTFDNLGIFGQGVLNFSSRFRGIVGLRYTIDNLTAFHSRVTTPNVGGIPGINRNFDQGVFITSNPPTNINGDPLASNGVPFRTQTDAQNLSGKAGLQFDVNDDVMLYGSWTRGYKGPAFNIFFNLNANGTNVIEPELSDAWEAGLKNSLFDGKLTLNIAAFHAKYRNFQANNPDLVAGVVITRFTNAGDVSTRGVEADFNFQPVSDLNIGGGVAYTDARVDAFRPVPGGASVPPGTPLAFAPKWKGALGIDYRWRTGGNLDFTFGVQGTTQSSQLSLFDPSQAVRDQGVIGAYSLVNAQIGLVQKDDRFRLTFFVNNIFDESFAAQITNGGPGGTLRYIIPREADRYFGLTARLGF